MTVTLWTFTKICFPESQGLFCITLPTIHLKCSQLVVGVKQPLKLNLVEDVQDFSSFRQVAGLEGHHALLGHTVTGDR